MRTQETRFALAVVAAAAVSIAMAQDLAAQARVVLPQGTVIPVRVDDRLSSQTAREGQRFRTTVIDTIRVDGYLVIPAGSGIEGVVSGVRRAGDRDPGVLALDFVSLRLPDRTEVSIDGSLTSTDPAERRQIEAQGDARVVLVGGRQGVGSVVAGAAGRGGGDAVSQILGALGTLLSEGSDVVVPPGTQLAVQLDRGIVMRAAGPAARIDAFTLFTSPEVIREAQQELRQRGYYRGSIDGRLDEGTRRALLEFQIDNRILATGNLDGRTAEVLGLSLPAFAALTPQEAAVVRRDAQRLLAHWGEHLNLASNGRLAPWRSYRPEELELYFALSAFADNAGQYEQIVRVSGNADGVAAAGGALVEAARRVDAALTGVTAPRDVQIGWRGVQNTLVAVAPDYLATR